VRDRLGVALVWHVEECWTGVHVGSSHGRRADVGHDALKVEPAIEAHVALQVLNLALLGQNELAVVGALAAALGSRQHRALRHWRRGLGVELLLAGSLNDDGLVGSLVADLDLLGLVQVHVEVQGEAAVAKVVHPDWLRHRPGLHPVGGADWHVAHLSLVLPARHHWRRHH